MSFDRQDRKQPKLDQDILEGERSDPHAIRRIRCPLYVRMSQDGTIATKRKAVYESGASKHSCTGSQGAFHWIILPPPLPCRIPCRGDGTETGTEKGTIRPAISNLNLLFSVFFGGKVCTSRRIRGEQGLTRKKPCSSPATCSLGKTPAITDGERAVRKRIQLRFSRFFLTEVARPAFTPNFVVADCNQAVR